MTRVRLCSVNCNLLRPVGAVPTIRSLTIVILVCSAIVSELIARSDALN